MDRPDGRLSPSVPAPRQRSPSLLRERRAGPQAHSRPASARHPRHLGQAREQLRGSPATPPSDRHHKACPGRRRRPIGGPLRESPPPPDTNRQSRERGRPCSLFDPGPPAQSGNPGAGCRAVTARADPPDIARAAPPSPDRLLPGPPRRPREEGSTWSARSKARTNDVEADEGRAHDPSGACPPEPEKRPTGRQKSDDLDRGWVEGAADPAPVAGSFGPGPANPRCIGVDHVVLSGDVGRGQLSGEAKKGPPRGHFGECKCVPPIDQVWQDRSKGNKSGGP
jgi:hypothetical protein